MLIPSYRTQQEKCPFIVQLATALGIPENEIYAKRVLSAFCQTIRERIAPISSNILIAHLPVSIQQLYLADWTGKCSKNFNYVEFINALYTVKGYEHENLFSTKKEVEVSVLVIFDFIKRLLSNNQYSEMMSFMPLSLRMNLITDYSFEEHKGFF